MRTVLLPLCFLLAMPAVAQSVHPQDVVINEILFDPQPDGFDYIELYNRSDSSIDLQALFLTNRNSSGSYGVLKKLCDTTRYLLPHSYVVFTEDAENLARHYFVKAPAAVIEVSSLPSYPNAEGTVALLTKQETVVDEVHYSENWQFALLANAEGVALERIDPDGPSNATTTWRSAAWDAGYGTPGYQNSQYQLFQITTASITVVPKIFSPDGDGTDDVATIQYSMPESGYAGNIFIYDASARQVRQFVKNAILGSTGRFTWDGLDENGRRLPAGHYIIYTEFFNLQGKKQHFKNVVVLARRLH